MTFTVTTEQVYLGIIIVLMIVQIFQWKSIYSLKNQVDQIWTQIAIVVTSVSQQIEEIKRKQNNAK